MFGLQSVKGEHVRQDRTAGHAGDEVGDRVAAPLRVEQIHHHHGERVVDGGKIVGGAGHQEQPHREPLQDRGGSAHVLRGKAAVLSSQRMVPTYTGDQKYDQDLHIPGNSDVADRHDELYAESTIARQRGVHGDTRGHDDVLAARGAKVLMETGTLRQSEELPGAEGLPQEGTVPDGGRVDPAHAELRGVHQEGQRVQQQGAVQLCHPRVAEEIREVRVDPRRVSLRFREIVRESPGSTSQGSAGAHSRGDREQWHPDHRDDYQKSHVSECQRSDHQIRQVRRLGGEFLGAGPEEGSVPFQQLLVRLSNEACRPIPTG